MEGLVSEFEELGLFLTELVVIFTLSSIFIYGVVAVEKGLATSTASAK